MSKELITALKQKYGSPKEALRALGLDEALLTKGKRTMAKDKTVIGLSRSAARLQGALSVALLPKMAKDKKLDLNDVLKDFKFKSLIAKDGKPDKDEIKKFCKLVKDSVMPMMDPAMMGGGSGGGGGAGPDDAIIAVVQALTGQAASAPPAELEVDDAPTPTDIPGTATTANDNEELIAFLKQCGMSDEQIAQALALCEAEEEVDPALAAADPDEAELNDDEDPDKKKDDETTDDEDDMKDKVDKKTMDAALKKMGEDTAAAVRKEMAAVAEAREFVRPFVGAVSLALDNVAGIYQAALSSMGVDAKEIDDPKALKLLIQQSKKDEKKPTESATTFAGDSAVVADLSKRYPHAAKIGI